MGRGVAASISASAHQAGWALARRTLLGMGLLLAFLQYYLINVYIQIVFMPSLAFPGPASNMPLQRSMLELLRSLTSLR